MSLLTGVALFFIFWWMILFITLPFKMRSQIEDGEITPGTEPGAPSKPEMGKRVFWNTVITIIVFSVYWFVIVYFDVTIEDLPSLL